MSATTEALQLAVNILGDKQEDARAVHDANKASGASPESLAFDAGRYDGLKEARNIILALLEANGRA